VKHERGYQGVTNEWHTPQYILDALGPFDDDPCTPEEFNGLAREWRGFVWMNPPYGSSIDAFMEHMAKHHNGIALTFARTETRWFYDFVWMRATALCFIKGRLRFIRNGKEEKGFAGAPSVLIAYGVEAEQRLRSALTAGTIKGVFMNYWNCKNGVPTYELP